MEAGTAQPTLPRPWHCRPRKQAQPGLCSAHSLGGAASSRKSSWTPARWSFPASPCSLCTWPTGRVCASLAPPEPLLAQKVPKRSLPQPPCRGRQLGVPGPAGQCRRGRQPRPSVQRPEGSSHTEALTAAAAPQRPWAPRGGALWRPALESVSGFKIPNAERFGPRWLESHLEEGPGFKLQAPGLWDRPTRHQASRAVRGTWGRREGREGKGRGPRSEGRAHRRPGRSPGPAS